MQRIKSRTPGHAASPVTYKRSTWADVTLKIICLLVLSLMAWFLAAHFLVAGPFHSSTENSEVQLSPAPVPSQTAADSVGVVNASYVKQVQPDASQSPAQLEVAESPKHTDSVQLPPPSPPAARQYTLSDYRRIGEALDPDVMKSVPESFNSSNINPCWNVSSTVYCMPYFYFLGGFQSGTYTLYDKIAQHPRVAKGHNPRYHFWAEYEKKFAQYMKEMSGAFPQVVQEGRILGDASESYFAFYWAAGDRMHRAFNSAKRPCREECIRANSEKAQQEACWRSKCYPLAQAADHKAAADLGIPFLDVQLPLILRAAYRDRMPYFVVLLRDPIARLHSAFWEYPHYPYRYNGTAQGFLAFVKEQVTAFRDCVGRGHSDVECALLFESLGQDEQDVWFHCDQVLRGLHSIYAKIWLQHFPREQFLFIRSEDYFADVNGTVKAVLKHLGLPLPTDEQFARMVAAQPHRPKVKEPMLPEARKFLLDFYQPYNEELAQLLGDPKFAWPEAPAKSTARSTRAVDTAGLGRPGALQR